MLSSFFSENMEKHSYSPIPQGKAVDEYTAKTPGWVSHLMFSWLSATMRLGYSRPLEENDVPMTAVGQEDTADLTLKLQNALNETPTDSKGRKKLWRCLLRIINPLDYAVYIGTMLGDSICGFIQPVLMNLIFWELKNDPGRLSYWNFVLASGMAFTLFLQPFFKSHCEYAANVIAAKIRSSLRGIMYQKVKYLYPLIKSIEYP